MQTGTAKLYTDLPCRWVLILAKLNTAFKIQNHDIHMGDLLCNITIQCTFRFVFCRSEILCLKLSFLFVFITLSYFHYKIFCRYIIINTECFHNSHRNMCFPIRHQTMECYQSQQLVLFFSFDTQTTKLSTLMTSLLLL